MNIRLILAFAAISLTLAGEAHANVGKQATERQSYSAAAAPAVDSKTAQYLRSGDPAAPMVSKAECPMMARNGENALKLAPRSKGGGNAAGATQ